MHEQLTLLLLLIRHQQSMLAFHYAKLLRDPRHMHACLEETGARQEERPDGQKYPYAQSLDVEAKLSMHRRN